MTSARCPDCDLDPVDWTVPDMRSGLAHLGDFWGYLLQDVDDRAPATPMRDAAAEQLAALSADLGLPGDDDVLAAGLAGRADEALLAQALHAGLHGVRLGGRALAGAGALGGPQTGAVLAVNASGGGLPKLPLAQATVTRSGLSTDRQAHRDHHGRPFQALCLWSAEVIEALRGEGHCLEPGFAGENLTLSGLDWPGVRPGVRLAIGDDLVAEISSYAVPCAQQTGWFAGGKFRRILHEEHPGWSRVYAYVVGEGGVVRRGDPVRLLP